MKEVINVEGLSKEYVTEIKLNFAGHVSSKKITKALDNVDFKVYEGEFIAIMGPSGSGKSTLVNMISTIDTPTKGKVIIDGERPFKMNEALLSRFRFKTIGFVFQDFNLIDTLSIRQNIGVPLFLDGQDKETIDKKIVSISEKLNVSTLLDKYPAECSGGQIQRVSIARALIGNPKIIIADEPTGNLDSTNSKNTMNLFKKLNTEDNITILMVTHDPLTASYANKAINIKDGKITDTILKKDLTQREFFNNILSLVSGDIDI